MDISVVGTGYVGLVAGTCLSDLGFHVTCVDNDPRKIEALQSGSIPIYEPGLDGILRRNAREGRLRFTLDGAGSIAASDVVFIAVGTPGLPDGSADLSGVLAVADLIGRNMSRQMTVVIKSTVPVGTADRVRAAVGLHAQHEFDVVSNPEFLREGSAIEDFNHPDRIVIGCATQHARDVMTHIYGTLVRTGRPILFMDNRSAEITKYASNALLATKISFMNEIARLCDAVGGDVEMVRRGVGGDTRIGPQFLFPGVGYGGSCFPKDVQALVVTARDNGIELDIANAVERVNARQKRVLVEKIRARFGGDLTGRHFAIWGLAFKPETDDLREAPAEIIIDLLTAAGATVTAYDPEALANARAQFDRFGEALSFSDAPMDALNGADALLLVTEWSEFRNPEPDELRARLRLPIVFDGRNIYDPHHLRAAGFEYYGIGRP